MKRHHPFWIVVNKELADHLRSWRFVILLLIILLTCAASMYTSLSTIGKAVEDTSGTASFLFLRLFTLSDGGALPSFITFISLLGPLLGIGLGFDAVNSERNKGTLARIIAQPIHRDTLLNAKFTASLLLISVLFLGLGFLIMGLGLLIIGVPPTPDEFLRMLAFLLISIFYVGFWLSLAIFFSLRFRQPATSALTSLSIWLFFSLFFQMIIGIINKATVPGKAADAAAVLAHQESIALLSRLSPIQLFSEATSTLLMPEVRTLGMVSLEQYQQLYMSLSAPLSFSQSLILVWPQWTGLIALTMICFALSYVSFMRQEIRSRN